MADDGGSRAIGAPVRRANARAGLTRWLSYVIVAAAAGLAVTFAVDPLSWTPEP